MKKDYQDSSQKIYVPKNILFFVHIILQMHKLLLADLQLVIRQKLFWFLQSLESVYMSVFKTFFSRS